MLNRAKHQLIMGRTLQDIYSDTTIAPLLGLKGGTCAYFFYGLPRFSVDLDFDLFSSQAGDVDHVREVIERIANKHATVKESQVKRYTLFWLLSYGEADRNIKIEVNTRQLIPDIDEHFELKEYLGISMLVGKKPYLFASKLAALTTRNAVVMRDVYDIWYFAKQLWDIDGEVIKIRTGKSVKEYLAECIQVIKAIKDNQILQGMGEFLAEGDKAWVRAKLRSETILLLKAYTSAL
ncbi:MAG: nucleotidyl transferase AbiEii/AbiGii toxin family protein [Anaerolineales bacterium]